MAFAVAIKDVDDKSLEFIGFFLVEENDEFKVYRDKFMQDHIVRKESPYIFFEELDEAQCIAPAQRIVTIGDGD